MLYLELLSFQLLCAHGAQVNAPGFKGMRPLHEAVENGYPEVARLLLTYGADPALTTYSGKAVFMEHLRTYQELNTRKEELISHLTHSFP